MGMLKSDPDRKGYLLDTHAFLWAVHETEHLGKNALRVLESATSELYLSTITAFEVTTKYRIGKLDEYYYVVDNYTEIIRKLGAVELPVTLAHAYQAGQMEWEDRDPFDRILVAQAALENLTLVTQDAMLAAHPWIETIW